MYSDFKRIKFIKALLYQFRFTWLDVSALIASLPARIVVCYPLGFFWRLKKALNLKDINVLTPLIQSTFSLDQ